MKPLLILLRRMGAALVALGLGACGGAQYNIQGMSNGSYQEGSLTLISGACYGSYDSLYFNGKSYSVSPASSVSARDEIDRLSGGSSSITAFSSTYCTRTYRVWFSGNFSRGPCPANSGSQCDLVSLDFIQAF